MGQYANMIMAGAQMGSSAAQSQARKKQGAAEETAYVYNAVIAEQQAQDAIARGEQAEGIQRINVKRLIGAQRAAYGAQGVEVDSGSALDVQKDTAAMGELDAIIIRNNAAREAWGYRAQAQDLLYRGRLAKTAASAEAGQTLLAGGLKAYQIYSAGKK